MGFFLKDVTGLNKKFSGCITIFGTSSVPEVKNPPAMQEIQETHVQSLGQKEPLEKEMATHSSILAWNIPWTEKPDGLQSMGSQRVRVRSCCCI